MRFRTAAIPLVVLLIAGPTRAQDATQDIAAFGGDLPKVLLAGNAIAIASRATKDFTFTDIFGHSGPAAQWSDRFKTIQAMAQGAMVSGLPPIVQPNGDAAMAILKLKVTGTGKDRLGEQGPMDMTVSYRTAWVKEDGAWKIKSAQEARFEGTTNRRPLSFSKSTAEEETRKGMQAMYGIIATTYEQRDWDKIEKGMPDGFVIHDMDGKLLTKAELMDRVKAGTKVVTNPIMTIDPQQVAFEGDKLYIIRVMRLLGDVDLPGGKTGRAVYTNVARDTFVKDGTTWKPKASDEIYAEATVNGLPVPLSAVSGK